MLPLHIALAELQLCKGARDRCIGVRLNGSPYVLETTPPADGEAQGEARGGARRGRTREHRSSQARLRVPAAVGIGRDTCVELLDEASVERVDLYAVHALKLLATQAEERCSH